jgi:glycosyltransferase involved in cell wall biosynthesis
MEHGCGLSYSTDHPSYAGGRDRQGVVLFLSPNRYTADRNAAAHPHIPQHLIGAPKLDPVWRTPQKQPGDPPLVVVSFHWDCQQAPEARSALSWYRPALRLLARQASVEGWQLAGHGHPRAMPALRKLYQAWGIPVLEDFAGVLAAADLYVVDNSSTLYEFAATGRPVVVLNAPWYRRNVQHGLRFWQHIPGWQVSRPAQLRDGISRALADPPELRALREAAVEAVYPVGRDGTAAELAAGHLTRLLEAG